jgi:hypothetical protein
VQGPMRPRVCLGVKHTLTNGGKCKGWSVMTPKCTPILGVAIMWELRMFTTLVGKRKTNTKLAPKNTIRKVLKHKCLKCLCIAHLNLICMSYDQKKGCKSNWKFDFQPQIPWKQGSNEVWWGVLNTIEKTFSRAIKCHIFHSKKDLIWKRYERSKFWDNKNHGERWHLHVVLTERHRIYSREGSGASSQRLQTM